jgi:hypothetical protein
MKPDVYFNNEVGVANTFENARLCILDAAQALFKIDKEIGDVCVQFHVDFGSLNISQENGNPKFMQDLFFVKGKNLDLLRYLFNKFSKGKKINPQGYNSLSIKGLSLNSEILEYALENDGMVLSFATDDFWKKDFIEFCEIEKSLPNIWGEQSLFSVKNWINGWHKDKDLFIDLLKRDFNLELCDEVKNDFQFSFIQENKIKSCFNKAKDIQYECGKIKELNSWQGSKTQVGVLKELRVLSEGIRIFFINYNGELIVGGSFKKGAGQTDKLQQKAANKAISNINKRFEN